MWSWLGALRDLWGLAFGDRERTHARMTSERFARISAERLGAQQEDQGRAAQQLIDHITAVNGPLDEDEVRRIRQLIRGE